MPAQLKTNTATATLTLRLNNTDTPIIFPELNDDGSPMLPQVQCLASYIERFPEAARAVSEMENLAIIFLSREQEEFHLQHAGAHYEIIDHFASHSRPGGNSLIICFTGDGCEISDELKDKRVALEQKYGHSLDLDALHNASMSNQPHIRPDSLCGCFYCKQQFKGADIKEYIMEAFGAKTALCPHCNIDAVLPAECLPAGVPLNEDIIGLMHESFFGTELDDE